MSERRWDDLRLFLEVARCGGLSAAARVTGLSAPTIGRRMLSLEQSLSRTLFDRNGQGYQLAADGQRLLDHVQAMEQAAAAVDRWQQEVTGSALVSIGTDALTLKFLVENIADLWLPDDVFRVCLKVIDVPVGLSHRSFNIGIADHRPESGNLAIRRSVSRSYAVFSNLRGTEAADRWVSLGTDVMTSPWMRWVSTHHEPRIAAWVNAPRTLVDVLEGGAGLGVLPCFVGERSALLERHGELIDELQHDTWIVSHDDDRRRPEIRLVLDRISDLMDRHREVFAPSVRRG